jgi:hypothetical protein
VFDLTGILQKSGVGRDEVEERKGRRERKYAKSRKRRRKS